MQGCDKDWNSHMHWSRERTFLSQSQALSYRKQLNHKLEEKYISICKVKARLTYLHILELFEKISFRNRKHFVAPQHIILSRSYTRRIHVRLRQDWYIHWSCEWTLLYWTTLDYNIAETHTSICNVAARLKCLAHILELWENSPLQICKHYIAPPWKEHTSICVWLRQDWNAYIDWSCEGVTQRDLSERESGRAREQSELRTRHEPE